ncbi:MAG TPA: VWA domain-containing protein [Acidobacteriaceae bacterium]|nr:VWA domain-containing protein [Nitrospira sp.]HEV2272746.1 VWA domain-containing protein [Acidobacteriaceae bacterium]
MKANISSALSRQVRPGKTVRQARFGSVVSSAFLACLLFLFNWTAARAAAIQGQQTDSAPKAQQTPDAAKQQDQTAPEEGGPGGDNGAIAIPKKPEKPTAPPPPPEPKVKNPKGLENYSMRVDVPVVSLNVDVILQKTHEFVPNLQETNFRVYEDGTPQKLISFQRTKAPITAVLLCEFASTNYWFIYDMQNAAYAFAQQLQPDDYVAVVTYDMKTQILTDFTQDKRMVYESLNALQIPGFSETNEFDALYETLDRLTRIEGRKYVILVSSGIDTFSKINLDKILKKIKDTPNVTIFTVGTGQAARITGNAPSGMFGPKEIDYLQADNELTTFARMTGGQAFFPRFEGEMPDIFHAINDEIRNQYVLAYTPTNPRQDGTYRKIRVELVDGEGQPLKMQDEKHHPLKYDIIARDGYRAKQEVE